MEKTPATVTHHAQSATGPRRLTFTGWLTLVTACAVSAALCASVRAHDGSGHHGPTYEVTPTAHLDKAQRAVRLSILDEASGRPLAARFTLQVDGQPYVPAALGQHGLRFVSIHQGKKQQFVATYARGTGVVEIPLPQAARRVVVAVCKGLEYLPATADVHPTDLLTDVTLRIGRWSHVGTEGWVGVDEHLHYERLQADHDLDWLTLLEADDLVGGHFLVLKGGNLPGIWATQYAYGAAGYARRNQVWIRSGEEFRDGAQGHINLLGIDRIIPPISTGGMGVPKVPHNQPAFHDVFQQTRALGGVGGPAHGGAYSRSPTAVLDVVLGVVDFFEIANTHLYKIDLWYQLMNCGYILPPAAGTDLPNFPYRDPWQPLMGEVRMYVRVEPEGGFAAWKRGLASGQVFVTSGPMIRLKVNQVGPGGTVRLEAPGDTILVEAELASPRRPTTLELVRNGQVVAAEVIRAHRQGVYHWHCRAELPIVESCWIAARGTGVEKQALAEHARIRQPTVAHTAAVKVLVAQQPIDSKSDRRLLLQQLIDQRQFYATRARYSDDQAREHMLQLLVKGINRLSVE